MRRSTLLAFLAVVVVVQPAAGQSLRDQLSGLFTFGSCGKPLCLDLDNEHGHHFIPSVDASNGAVLSFITESIARSSGSTPIGGTSSGATYSIVGGLPVRTSTSAGPIIGERSQTLGRGRLFFGTNVTAVSFTTLNGSPLDRIDLTFAHEDVGAAGLGNPSFENDLIRVQMNMKVNLLVSSLVATYGLTDFADIGIAVPYVRTSVRGTSVAQIDPFGSPTPHFFAGDLANPVLRATSAINGNAAGLGDVVGRFKVNLGQNQKLGAAILGEVRFPTGNDEELLGAGAGVGRVMGIAAAQFGRFSPHVNAGYIARTGDLETDAIATTIGFDNLMTDWATLALDVITERQVGDSKLVLPGDITITTPYLRQFRSTSFPERREDRLDLAAGLKFTLRGGTVLMTNAVLPLRKAGLQSDFYWTAGLEFSR